MTIPCPTCRGKGKTKLSAKLQNVLDVAILEPVTIAFIHFAVRGVERTPKLSLTAVHRRVERLLQMKLIKKVDADFPQKYGLAK